MPPAAAAATRFRESDPTEDDLLARSVNDTTSSPVRKSKRVFIAGAPVGPLRRTPLKSPRVSIDHGAGSFALQDFYVTPPPPSSPLRRGSPTRSTVAQTDDVLSPWRIRVRVDAEREDDEEVARGSSRGRLSMSPAKYPGGRTVTTTIPLRGGDSSPPVKRGRGRPRRSDTAPRRKGTPRPVKTRRLSQEELEREDLGQATPKRSPGRPQKSIETDSTPRQITPAKSPSRVSTSTTKSKRGRRKTTGPFNIESELDIEGDHMAEPISFADDEGYAILPNEEMMEEVLNVDNEPSEDELDGVLSVEPEDVNVADDDAIEDIENVEDVEDVAGIENFEDLENTQLEATPPRPVPSSPLQPRSSLSPQKGRRRKSSLSTKADAEIEDPTNHHREYDSIMESEGFSMVSLNTLPSAQHLRLQAVLEEENEPPLLDGSQLSEELRTDYDPTGPVPDINSSHLAKAIKHITPLKPAASPALPPPPKVVVTTNSPRALEKPDSGTPKLVRVVRAGIALQGVVDEDEPEVSEPSKQAADPSPVAKSPRERLDALFSGFGAGTQRELRAGLRLGEELAKRQRLAKLASHRAWTNENDDDVFSDKAETPEKAKAPSPQQYNLKVPAPRRPTPSSTVPNEQLPSPDDSGEVPDDDKMSWRLDTPSQSQLMSGAKRASLSPQRILRARRTSSSPQRSANAKQPTSSPQRATRTKQPSSSPQRAQSAKEPSGQERLTRNSQAPSSPQRTTLGSKQNSSSPQQRNANTKAKIAPKSMAQREAEWNEERKAVSQQIQSANASQVVVINSDDPTPSALKEVDDEEESEEDVPPPEPTLDIWQEEAKTSSSHMSFARVEEPKRDDPNDFTKPPRSKLPTPWRRQSNTQLVYSDEADMEEPSWIKRKSKRKSSTPDASPENRKRTRFSSPVEQPSPERAMSDDHEDELEESPIRPVSHAIPASVEKRVRQQLLGEVSKPQKQAQRTPPQKKPQPVTIEEEHSEDDDADGTQPTEEETLPPKPTVLKSLPKAKDDVAQPLTPQLAEPAEIKPKSRSKVTPTKDANLRQNPNIAEPAVQTQTFGTLAGWVQSVTSLPSTVSSWFAPSSLKSLPQLAFQPPTSPTRTVRQPATVTGRTTNASSNRNAATTVVTKRKHRRSSQKAKPATEPFSLYLPWNLTHYRRLNMLYLDSLSHSSSYPLSKNSPTAYLLGKEVFSMGWRKPLTALELGVADAFLALLRREGVDDVHLRGRQPRVDGYETAKRVFSLWVGRVQRNETPLHDGVAGDWNASYAHLRKPQLEEQKRWRREMAKRQSERAAAAAAVDKSTMLKPKEPHSPPHRRVQQLRKSLI